MTRKKNKKRKKELYLNIFTCIMSISFLLILSVFLYNTNLLKPKLNEVTASYISFSNSKETDTIKINEIEKNKKCKKINLSGKIGTQYEMILYPTGNIIDYEYIYYTINNKEYKLDYAEMTVDKGRKIYNGTINKDKEIELCIWISNKLKEKTSNINFDVIIK